MRRIHLSDLIDTLSSLLELGNRAKPLDSLLGSRAVIHADEFAAHGESAYDAAS
jgi:hypothetical protein